MIKEIQIKNFKSIVDETISLGRVNVFIGENGSGKSNLLEAIAFASVSAENDRIDTEALYNKGIRVAKPTLTFSSYFSKEQLQEFQVILRYDEGDIEFDLIPDDINDIFSKWKNNNNRSNSIATTELINSSGKDIAAPLNKVIDDLINSGVFNSLTDENKNEIFDRFKESFLKTHKRNLSLIPHINSLRNYLIYAINTHTLRGIPSFQESKKEPLGINGENLDILISDLDSKESEELKSYSYMVNWLDSFRIDRNDLLKSNGYKFNKSKSSLYFTDKFMMKKNNIFSTENANEGILHVLFYLSLLISKKTPKLFAIDNIETCLNPHLCREIMKKICALSEQKNKQLLVTTHNPAILDGLDIGGDEIRLFQVYRDDTGQTKTKRIQFKEGKKPEDLKLSELWMKGYLGTVSKRF